MSISQDLFAEARLVPEMDEEDWGPEATSFLVDALAAANAVACKMAAGGIFTRRVATSSTVTAAASLTALSSLHVLTAASAVTLNGTTAIADGEIDRQQLRLVGTSDTNTVTVLSGANTLLNGLVTLGLNESIDLEWDLSNSYWREVSRSN